MSKFVYSGEEFDDFIIHSLSEPMPNSGKVDQLLVEELNKVTIEWIED